MPWEPGSLSFKQFDSNTGDTGGSMIGNLNRDTVGTVGAQYVITCKDIFDCDIAGMEGDSAPILWVESGSARLYTQDPGGEHSGDGRIVGMNTLIYMKYGAWAPKLQQRQADGTIIESISIKRLASINGMKKVIQTMVFGVCSVIVYKQTNDIIKFNFNYANKRDESNSVWQGDGAENGVVAVQVDYGTMVTGS
ncbi:MAG: hypothetical protein LBJ16_02425 [Holosporaceae bacterium]|jgi:hypothetical protein|nr:hypothetical protein [Holosporaceae bacterium]